MKKHYKKERKVVQIKDLKRHPFAADIYQISDIEKLAENINRNGIIHGRPALDSDNNILVGCRVIEACRALG